MPVVDSSEPACTVMINMFHSSQSTCAHGFRRPNFHPVDACILLGSFGVATCLDEKPGWWSFDSALCREVNETLARAKEREIGRASLSCDRQEQFTNPAFSLFLIDVLVGWFSHRGLRLAQLRAGGSVRPVHEHELLCMTLELRGSYDQLDLGALASMEVLSRSSRLAKERSASWDIVVLENCLLGSWSPRGIKASRGGECAKQESVRDMFDATFGHELD